MLAFRNPPPPPKGRRECFLNLSYQWVKKYQHPTNRETLNPRWAVYKGAG